MQLIDVLGQGAAAGLVGFIDDIPHLAVDLGSGGLAVALALTQIAAQEGLLLRGTVHHRAKPLREAVLGDHLAGNVGGLLQIIGSTGGDILQDQLFGHAAAQTGNDILEHFTLCHVAAVFLGQVHGVAASLTTRDNGDLVHTGVMLAVEARHSVACLVVSSQLLFLRGHNAALLLRASHHLHGSFLDILHGNGLAVAACSQQSRFVDKVLKVCACKACGALCNDPERDIRGQRLLFGVDLEDLLTALDIRQAHIDLTIKAARTQQGLIQNVGTVGGRHDDDAVVGLKAVHFHQQLVQGLLAFIVAAAQTGTALTAHSIDLINEDDAGHGLLCLIEQVTHAGCTHADVHFHKVRAGNGIEGHTGLSCAGAGQQGLAGARRAYQQHAVGNACAQSVELFRAFQELHDLFQLFLFLVLTGNIGKGGCLLVLVLVLHLGFANVHDSAAASTAAHHGEQQEAGAAQHCQIEQDLHPWDVFLDRGIIVHHGSIRVCGIVGGNVVAHILDEHGCIGQLVAHSHSAVAVLLRSSILIRGGQHTAQQSAGGLRGALGRGIGQGQVVLAAFLEVHGDDTGVQVQRELRDLQAFKIMHHRGIFHGRAAGRAGAAQHRPDHQHRRQRQSKDQRIETGSFGLQKNQLQFLDEL